MTYKLHNAQVDIVNHHGTQIVVELGLCQAAHIKVPEGVCDAAE